MDVDGLISSLACCLFGWGVLALFTALESEDNI